MANSGRHPASGGVGCRFDSDLSAETRELLVALPRRQPPTIHRPLELRDDGLAGGRDTIIGRVEIRRWDTAMRDRRRLAAPGVNFIEAVAIPDEIAPSLTAGTVVLVVSAGARHQSWWRHAAWHLDRDIED